MIDCECTDCVKLFTPQCLKIKLLKSQDFSFTDIGSWKEVKFNEFCSIDAGLNLSEVDCDDL